MIWAMGRLHWANAPRRPTSRRAVRRLVMVLGALGLAGCSGSSTYAGSAPTAANMSIVDLRGKAAGSSEPEVTVTVRDNEFDPPGIRIDPGVTVKWHNEGRTIHNIERADPKQVFGTGPAPFGADELATGASFSYRFATPGVYRYYCTLHGSPQQGMIGEIVVGNVAVPAQP